MQLIWITFFRFFRKSFKKLWPQFEGSFCKYDLKKIYAYPKPRNFKILTNKTNQIAGFEIILKDGLRTCDIRNSRNNQHNNNQHDN